MRGGLSHHFFEYDLSALGDFALELCELAPSPASEDKQFRRPRRKLRDHEFAKRRQRKSECVASDPMDRQLALSAIEIEPSR